MPRKACKIATFEIHKTGQKPSSIIKRRVLIYFYIFSPSITTFLSVTSKQPVFIFFNVKMALPHVLQDHFCHILFLLPLHILRHRFLLCLFLPLFCNFLLIEPESGNAFNNIADIIRTYSKDPDIAAQRLSNLLEDNSETV